MAKGGRPTKFTKKMKERILELRREGKSIRQICKAVEISTSTFQNWIEDPQFSTQYARASNIAFDAEFEDLEEIADMALESDKLLFVKDVDGNVIAVKIDNSYINALRLKIDTRKWALSKKRPEKYGVKADAPEPVRVETEFVASSPKFDTIAEQVEYQKQVMKAMKEIKE